MKKLLVSVAALSLLTAGAASAQDPHDHGGGGASHPSGSGGAHMGAHDNGGPARGAGPAFAPGARFQGGGQQFHGDARVQGNQQFRDQRFQGDPRFQGNSQFRSDQRFQGNQQFRGNPGARPGAQMNAGRNWTHNDFRNWRGGRGPWVNDRNWFRNNWRFQSPGRYRGGYYNWPRGWYGYRNWYYGAILPGFFLNDDYILGDWYDYGLYEPPYGYEWVRVGPDILLVDPYTGRIVQVDSDAFY